MYSALKIYTADMYVDVPVLFVITVTVLNEKIVGIYIFYEFAKFIMAVIVRCIFKVIHEQSSDNLFCVLQILYDLGSFNFYTETYSEALLMFTQCLNTITEVCTGIHLLFLHFHPTNTLPQVTVSLIIWFK